MGIDAYSWLHKGGNIYLFFIIAIFILFYFLLLLLVSIIDWLTMLFITAYSCSMEICLNSDNDRKWRYLDYCMHRINLLRHYKIVPVVVFDGGNVPCKAATEQERRRHETQNVILFWNLIRPLFLHSHIVYLVVKYGCLWLFQKKRGKQGVGDGEVERRECWCCLWAFPGFWHFIDAFMLIFSIISSWWARFKVQTIYFLRFWLKSILPFQSSEFYYQWLVQLKLLNL